MKLSLLLILCSLTALQAQVGLVIEDETDKGFFLGVNGYLQNAESASRWHTTGLDTVPFIVQIESDTVDFIKKIHLREKAQHHYVLTYNSRGELKLRYRGTVSDPKTKPVAWSQKLEWPEDWVPRGNKPHPADPPAMLTASQDIQHQPMPEDTAETPDTLLLPGNKLVTVEEDTGSPTPPEPEVAPFDKLLQELKAEDFEFERLKLSENYLKEHRIHVEELQQIFTLVKYDNTRLQLFEVAYPRLINPRDAEELLPELEYDISRQNLKKRLDEK